MESLRQLIDFVENGRLGDRLLEVESRIGRKHLRVAGIILLQWILNQVIDGDRSPLECSCNFNWAQNLALILALDSDLASLFLLSEGLLDFHPALAEKSRDVVRATVSKDFHPILYD